MMNFNELGTMIKKYAYIYEIQDGDKGFVLAESREEAIDKLVKEYGDLYNVRERIEETDKDDIFAEGGFFFVYKLDNNIPVYGDIFVTEEY